MKTKSLDTLRIKIFERPFRKLTLSDKAWIEKACIEDGGMGSHITFINMLICQELYPNDCFRKGIGECVVKKPWEDGGKLYFQYPIGAPSARKETAKKIINLYSRVYKRIVFFAVSEENLKELKELCGDKIIDVNNPIETQGYVYNVQEQISLEGSRFSTIRSKLRKFENQNNWTYEDVTKENLAECIKINEQWYELHEKTNDVEQEQYSLKRVFELFDEFDFRGGILRVDGKAIAFNLGIPINKDVFLGMYAKADKNYLYASIFMIHEFIKRACTEYSYFNFTEDGGVLGLRKFKNELRPACMSPFYYVTIDTEK